MRDWKTIKGFDNYLVSSSGEIKNKRSGKLLKPQRDYKGYLEVWLHKEGKREKHSIHRLVAQTFIPNTQNKPQVNHKDGNKANNDITNLEWVTNQENIKHSFRELKREKSGGMIKGVAKKKVKGGEGVRLNLKLHRIAHRMTQDQMSKRLGVSRATYNNIESGKRNGSLKFWLSLKREFPEIDIEEMEKIEERA